MARYTLELEWELVHGNKRNHTVATEEVVAKPIWQCRRFSVLHSHGAGTN
jgi:hypothetical protein